MRMDSFGWLPVLVLQNYWKTMYLISRALDKHEGGCEIEVSGSVRGQKWQRGCRVWKGKICRFGKEDWSTEVERKLSK